MFFEEETKDTHGNMDDYDLDIEQGESVSWDKLLDDKDDLDEPADLETKKNPDDEDITDKLLNMDDDSFDAFVVKQQQAAADNPEGASRVANEVDFDEFLLDDLEEETEDALKKAVKHDLASDNTYAPEVVQEEDFEEDEDTFDFIQEEDDVQPAAPAVQTESQNIQQEIAQINDLDEEEEPALQYVQAEEKGYEVETAEAFVDEEEDFNPDQFAEATPDVPALAGKPQAQTDVNYNRPETPRAANGNFTQRQQENVPKKQNSSMMTILLALALLAGGGYYAYTTYGDQLNLGGTSEEATMEVAQDESLAGAPQGDTSAVPAPPADASDVPMPPAEVGDVPAPPVEAGAPSAEGKPNADVKPPADTQATKSVSKAIEQGRTKISKDKTEDKTKTSIQVVTTGRLNPFVPVGNLNNIGFITSPKIDILPPSETLAEPDPLLDKLMSIKVSGILYDGVNSSAVINLGGVDYFVQKGDKIDSFTVVDITKTTVAIKEKNNIFSASIGQTFTGTEIIKGQTQIQRQNNTVVRQYTTASDININTNNNNNNNNR
ncbi:hypothetical protein IKA15_01855 [bacterium]|nr:hypothetical protein [bacterium]